MQSNIIDFTSKELDLYSKNLKLDFLRLERYKLRNEIAERQREINNINFKIKSIVDSIYKLNEERGQIKNE